jgi:DNA-binding transcriptional LysR family regulator
MFETVARLGSYSKAAGELGVSQPSVSVQVQELEKTLGAQLFERAGRRNRLTEVGTAFYARSVQILGAVEEAMVDVDGYLGLERGRLRVGAIECIGLYLLPDAMRGFAEAHPGIDVELTIETTDEIAGGLRSGRLDLGFGDEEMEDDEWVEATQIGTAEYVVITSRNHSLALQQKAPSMNVAGETFIVEGDGSPSRRGLQWLTAGMEGRAPNVGMEVTSGDALKRMVQANLGIAVTYDFCVAWEYSSSVLHIMHITDLGTIRYVYQYLMSGSAPSPAAGEFIRLFHSVMNKSLGAR